MVCVSSGLKGIYTHMLQPVKMVKILRPVIDFQIIPQCTGSQCNDASIGVMCLLFWLLPPFYKRKVHQLSGGGKWKHEWVFFASSNKRYVLTLAMLHCCYVHCAFADFMSRWWRWTSLFTASRWRGRRPSGQAARCRSSSLSSLSAWWLFICQPKLPPRSRPCCNAALTSRLPPVPCWFNLVWGTRALNM